MKKLLLFLFCCLLIFPSLAMSDEVAVEVDLMKTYTAKEILQAYADGVSDGVTLGVTYATDQIKISLGANSNQTEDEEVNEKIEALILKRAEEIKQ